MGRIIASPLTRRRILQATIGGLALPVFGSLARAQNAEADLIAAARREGKVTFYSVIPQNVMQPMIDLFRTRYGVAMDYQRLTSGPLSQRYAAEAGANNVVADALAVTDIFFMDEAASKNWFTDLPQVPAMAAYPKNFVTQRHVTIQANPHGFVYNTQGVPAAAATSWQALIDPRFKGRVLLNDPRTSFSSVAFYYVLREAFGADYLVKLKDQGSFVASMVVGGQQVAAGAGLIQAPAFPNVSQPLTAQGAPIELSMPSPTFTADVYFGVSARAPNPNAARLLMNFLLTAEGQTITNQGSSSPLGALPGTFALPPVVKLDHNAARAATADIFRAFGLS
jgi:iron(III) transport system substrate-binding protein